MSSSKRHFTVVINSKEHGLYISSTPSSAARKAVSKLCTDNKNKKVEFFIRETTQGSNKKVYGPYLGEMKKLDKPVKLEGRIIQYKPIVKLKKKVSKMKGGEVLGIGEEGVVIYPNINSKNMTKVSKLIEISSDKQRELHRFEEALNIIDQEGKYHVRMIPEESHELSNNFYNMTSINQSNKNEFKRAMNEREKNNRKSITPNFKITYDYGGISIQNFLKHFKKYKEEGRINPDFCKNILSGLKNIFEGLYRFYKRGIAHRDLHDGNVVFPIENPANMRLIDWGNLLENRNNSLNNNFKESLINFYSIVTEILNQLDVFLSNTNISEKIKAFLNIPIFNLYKSYSSGMNTEITDEMSEVMSNMQEIIDSF
jgi:hypothetical protein